MSCNRELQYSATYPSLPSFNFLFLSVTEGVFPRAGTRPIYMIG